MNAVAHSYRFKWPLFHFLNIVYSGSAHMRRDGVLSLPRLMIYEFAQDGQRFLEVMPCCLKKWVNFGIIWTWWCQTQSHEVLWWIDASFEAVFIIKLKFLLPFIKFQQKRLSSQTFQQSVNHNIISRHFKCVVPRKNIIYKTNDY